MSKKLKKKNNKGLSAVQIAKQVSKRIEKYNKLNFLEVYAMYMGTAQLLEIGLKNLLVKKFKYDDTRIERWTLGSVAKELEKNGLRQDFIFLLKNVNDSRNNIAHSLLADNIIINSLLSKKDRGLYSKPYRVLSKAIYEIEQLYFLFEWTEKTNNWD